MRSLTILLRFRVWLENPSELEYITEPERRRDTLDEIRTRVWKDVSYDWRFLVVMLCVIAGDFLLRDVDAYGWIPAWGWLRSAMRWFPAWSCFLAIAIVAWLVRRSSQQELRRCLHSIGVLLCLHCGYDLRGQTEPRCPECGRAFNPDLP